MAAEILTIGDKMDLHHIYSAMGGLLAEKTYTSQLLDFDGIRHAKILMPIVGNRVVPLELQDEYELLFCGPACGEKYFCAGSRFYYGIKEISA